MPTQKVHEWCDFVEPCIQGCLKWLLYSKCPVIDVDKNEPDEASTLCHLCVYVCLSVARFLSESHSSIPTANDCHAATRLWLLALWQRETEKDRAQLAQLPTSHLHINAPQNSSNNPWSHDDVCECESRKLVGIRSVFVYFQPPCMCVQNARGEWSEANVWLCLVTVAVLGKCCASQPVSVLLRRASYRSSRICSIIIGSRKQHVGIDNDVCLYTYSDA